MSITPVFVGVGINSEDGETCNITLDRSGDGFKVEVHWLGDNPEAFNERLKAKGINTQADPTSEYYSMTFHSTKPLGEIIELLDEVVKSMGNNKLSLDFPVYGFQLNGRPDLTIVCCPWNDNNTLLSVSEADSLTTDETPEDGLTPEQWAAYSRTVVDNDHPAGRNLCADGLVVWEVHDRGFGATLPDGQDIEAAMMEVARCHPHVTHP